MHAGRLDQDLTSEDPERVLGALARLEAPDAGPYYPRARVLGLLGPESADRVREAALRLVLRRGAHPVSEPAVLGLLSTAPLGLFRASLAILASVGFPSAAEETLVWCFEQRKAEAFRLATIGAVEPLGAEVARRFVARFRLLWLPEEKLVAAGLAVLARTRARGADHVFEAALRHPDPRLRTIAIERQARNWEARARPDKLRPFLSDTHHRVRSTAAVLLFPDEPDGALAILEGMSRSRKPLDRAAAAWGLGAIGSQAPRPMALLSTLGGDADPLVATRAQASLRGLWGLRPGR